ncbi:hypothetical protein B0H19DRAFT_1262363 [Mycena capillaripes]|nr:hypothetical protein B0H19DRAFT_1262363 [Mycena capillaripes]
MQFTLSIFVIVILARGGIGDALRPTPVTRLGGMAAPLVPETYTTTTTCTSTVTTIVGSICSACTSPRAGVCTITDYPASDSTTSPVTTTQPPSSTPNANLKHPSTLEYATITARLLQNIASSHHVPFLQPISAITLLIIEGVTSMKANTKRFIHLVELINQLEGVIITTCSTSEYVLPLETLHPIAQFAQTLQKVHGCVRSQQEMSKITLIFKQSDITAQVEKCESEIQDALQILKLNTVSKVSAAIGEIEAQSHLRHEELLKVFETCDRSEYSCSVGFKVLMQQILTSMVSWAEVTIPAVSIHYYLRGQRFFTDEKRKLWK